MKVVVVYAHPNPKSFNHAIMESFTAGLAEAGHDYEVIDLYGINFNPSLTTADFEKLMQGKTSDDVKAQQEKLSRSDGLCIIHPIWWTGPPAILKGWVDRVFSLGFAYSFDKKTGSPIGLLKHKKAVVINTAGGREADAKKAGSPAAIKTAEIDGIFKFCGIKEVQHMIFYSVIMTDDAMRKAYLEEAKKLGKIF
jgi:NAD(P)H dehydrogenase (quinone)